MRDAWLSLGAATQDMLVLAALLLPILLVGTALLHGYAPLRLVRALLWRDRWTNLVFGLLIAGSVGMGIGLLAQERGLRAGMAAAADRFDLVVAAPGSELTALLASVFLQPTAVPLLDGETFAAVAAHPHVVLAAPLGFGDSHDGMPIVGTTAAFVDHLAGGKVEGRPFRSAFEAVIGAAVPLGIGARVEPAHGAGDAAETGVHADAYAVVGRMAPTGSPWDRAIVVPIEGVWVSHGLQAGSAGRIGPPFDAATFPGTPAIVVKADSLAATYALRSEFDGAAGTMAFFPGTVLSKLHGVMGDVRQAMSLMASVSQGLVAAGVLLGLFLLTRLFRRQLALLRALGAPARFVCAVVWSYAVVLLAAGSALGLAAGILAAAVLSRMIGDRTGILVRAPLGWGEVHLVAGFLCLAALAALGLALLVVARGARPAPRG